MSPSNVRRASSIIAHSSPSAPANSAAPQATTPQGSLRNAVEDAERLFAGIPLDRTGTFGYTVRVLPNSDLLATPAELGLIASA